ncbi:LysE family translocator [Enterovibrio norvegicus]|uniref:Homoserine lactone transporter n=1 Tax=Enterovibrio norvegicus TaxID=188144 RepID=A0A2N7L768_9GAMM|nr:LysE family translocator [Enterovibrio norvegicus]PMN89810.1 hypothetical protein BCT23_22110 [Enterovibrio norvegicus]
MDWSNSLLFAMVVGLMVVSPGPNGLLIIKNVPSFGRISGYYNVAGIATAFYVHGTLTVFGLSLLIMQSPLLYGWIKVAGGSYLVFLGVKCLKKLFEKQTAREEISETDSIQRSEHTPLSQPSFSLKQKATWYIEGLVTNAFNPKVSLFYIAAFPQFIDASNVSFFAAYSLVTIHAVIAICWFSFLTVMVSVSLAKFSQNRRLMNMVNAISGTLLGGLGLNVLLSSR